MKCDECNGTLNIVTGDFPIEFKSLGEISVPDITYTKCESCGDILLSSDMAQRVSTFKKQKVYELIEQLPVGDFLTVNEAIEILGVTKQAFSKNNKIKRGFIYYVEINKKKLYHNKSVELFKETGDGRFLLSKKPKRTSRIECKASYNAHITNYAPCMEGNCFADMYLLERPVEVACYV